MVARAFKKGQKGNVMIAVLIIAVAVAVVSYGLLLNSLNAIDRSDVQDYRVKAKALAEAGLDEAAFSIKQDPNYLTIPENPGIVPGWAGGPTDTEIKQSLISNDGTAFQSIDELPGQSYHAAFSEYELSSFDTPDLFFVWGDTEQATYEYIDEYTYKRHFFDYHYNPYRQDTDIFLGASGEVNDNLNDRVFSYASRSYPSNITRYQARTNSAWEPNENDPLPAYFESRHNAYKTDTDARYWTVTYDHDRDHPGRKITAIDLLAKPGELAIGSPGDSVWATPWNGTSWDPPMAIPPNFRQGPYTNATNLLSDGIKSTSIRVGMRADDIVDPLGLDYGFRLNGIKYYFGSDKYSALYETPHPYDQVTASLPGSPFVQTIYSPYQADPGSPIAVLQRMRITFDWRFFLEAGDTLRIMNLAGNPPYVIATLAGSDGAGQTYEATREDTDVPLAIGLFFDNDGDNISSTKNYGYLVETLQYINEQGTWSTVSEPFIETPHLASLGSFLPSGGFPDYAMYNNIYRPNVPGGGSLNGWEVRLDDGCDLYSAVSSDEDYIRITTPGFDPYGGLSDTHYFVSPYGAYGGNIGSSSYHDITELKGRDYDCGLSPYMEIYCHIDDRDDYANVAQNWGFRADWIAYTADDASDIAPAPTVAATVSSPPNKGYLNYGAGPDSSGEWWITDKKTDGDVVETIGIHFDLLTFDLDPGDYIAIYDEDDNLVGTLTFRSFVPEGPDGSPPDDDDLEGSGPQDEDPHATGPENAPGWDKGTIDLNDTRGWVIVPGESAHLILVGDGDDNNGHLGFRVDRTAWFSGFVDYSALGSFARLPEEENESAEYQISGKSEFLDIR